MFICLIKFAYIYGTFMQAFKLSQNSFVEFNATLKAILNDKKCCNVVTQ